MTRSKEPHKPVTHIATINGGRLTIKHAIMVLKMKGGIKVKDLDEAAKFVRELQARGIMGGIAKPENWVYEVIFLGYRSKKTEL